jgi:transposase InsO family protein
MQVSRSSYYHWRRLAPVVPDKEEVLLREKVVHLFKKSRNTYGSRRMVMALEAMGITIGRFKARRLMKILGLEARYPKKYKATTDSTHSMAIAPNILDRKFNPDKPGQVWTTDISYVWTLEGFVYVATIMDLYSRQIVGWAIDDHMRTSLCLQALQMAYWRKKPEQGLLHHSDRGSQYASHEYREALERMGMRQSMSRKGNCWDNAPKERFFRSLKYECLNYERLVSKAEAKLHTIDYIAFYNGQRIHSSIAYKTPLAAEQEFYSGLRETALAGAPGWRGSGQSTNRGRGASDGTGLG